MMEIGALMYALRENKKELAKEQGRRIPNEGTIQRLKREVAKIEAKIVKVKEKERQKLERQKAKGRKPLKTNKPLKSKGTKLESKVWANAPAKERRKERGKKRREEQFSIQDGYRAFIVDQPCMRCGKPGPSDPAHMRGVDLGGKADALLPLCRLCHTWQEVHKVQFDEEFEQRHGMAPLEMARAMRDAYPLQKD